ncbi:MAG: Sjogren's syndrome/scleroderma autoantigen 1 family protein [Candidatus Bathyarchaeia archaeon]
MRAREGEDQYIKRMADMLRQGHTLTDLACPACASPIFKLKSGELWCGRCDKKVILVKEDEEISKVTSAMALETLESALMKKIQDIQNKMQREENPEELQKLSAALSELLGNLEKIRKAKKF